MESHSRVLRAEAKRNPLKTNAWEAKVFGLYDKFASTDFPVLGSRFVAVA